MLKLGQKFGGAIIFLCLIGTATHATEPLTPLALLQKLIQLDTTNPPGNELVASQWVKNYLKEFGVEAEIFESAPGRGNLVARLKGNGTRPSLALLGHLDVVPADPAEWSYPPFGAEIHEGYLYGRGAIDMKFLVALEIHTFLQAHLQHWALGGDLVLILVSDEEAGGRFGAQFLTEQHWDKVQADWVFNEGSIGLKRGDLHLYPIQVAEKGVAWLELVTHGTSGHGSMPIPDNAVIKMVQALERLIAMKMPLVETPIVAEFLHRLATHFSFPKSFLMRHLFSWPIRNLAPTLAGSALESDKIFNAMVRNTCVPTVLQAGQKTNVIPGKARAEVDCRILPGETPEGFVEKIKDWANEETLEVKLLQKSLPNESPFQTEYFSKIEAALVAQDPQAIVVPFISPGATDNRFFRAKGALAYGIIPALITPDDLAGLHGKNERVATEELDRGEAVLRHLIQGTLVQPAVQATGNGPTDDLKP